MATELHLIDTAQRGRLPTILGGVLAVIACAGCITGEISSPPLPELELSVPSDGATDVARSAWVRLRFVGAVEKRGLTSVALRCGGEDWPIDIDRVDPQEVVINPRVELLAGSSCEAAWMGPLGPAHISFAVAGAGEPAVIAYEPASATRIAPFPDDWWLVDDAATKTGVRIEIPVPDAAEDRRGLLQPLIEAAKDLDGFSPLAAWVVELPSAPNLETLPKSAAESLDKLSSVGLYDVTPGSPFAGSRTPIDVIVRSDEAADGTLQHALIVVPSIPLRPAGRYALVVEKRACVDASRPFETSSALTAGLGLRPPENDVEQRLAALLEEPLAVLRDRVTPPRRPEDLALVLRASIRSMDGIARDLLAVRQELESMAVPTFTVDQVSEITVPGSPRAAEVSATWHAPSWSGGQFFARGANGLPQSIGTIDIPFVLVLPKAALDAPVPLVVHLHGWPGDAQTEVPMVAERGLAAEGFAVVGFTDLANRVIAPGSSTALQVASFNTIVSQSRVPEFLSALNIAEDLSFLYLLPELSSLDVLPVGSPDGKPEIDASMPLTVHAVSQGAAHAVGMLPYAPEIRGAALVAGAGRLSLQLMHQLSEELYGLVSGAYPGINRIDFYVGLSLFQMGYDAQDPLNHAPFIFREPLDLGTGPLRSNVLLQEGIGDTYIPPYNTRATAEAIGLSQLGPAIQEVPFLDLVPAPVSGNINADTTGAFYQFAASGVEGVTPSPGCENEPEGHFCPQSSPAAVGMRLQFLTSALEGGAATAVDPYDAQQP